MTHGLVGAGGQVDSQTTCRFTAQSGDRTRWLGWCLFGQQPGQWSDSLSPNASSVTPCRATAVSDPVTVTR